MARRQPLAQIFTPVRAPKFSFKRNQTVLVETTFHPDEGRLLTVTFNWTIDEWSKNGQRGVVTKGFESPDIENVELGLNVVEAHWTLGIYQSAGTRPCIRVTTDQGDIKKLDWNTIVVEPRFPEAFQAEQVGPNNLSWWEAWSILQRNKKIPALWTIPKLSLCISATLTDSDVSRNGLHPTEVQAIETTRQLQQLRALSSLSDVVFTTSDDKEVHAHRIVLAASSEYFLAMFEHRWLESSSAVCAMPEVDYESLQIIVDAIYGMDVAHRLTSENAEKVLIAAHMFQLAGICAMCVPVLGKNLSLENVVERVVLAKRYDLEDLMRATVEFVTKDHDQFLDADGLERLRMAAPQLEREFLKRLLKTR